MVEALRASGWTADTIFYRDAERDELFDRVVAKADAYVSRINPGTIPGESRPTLTCSARCVPRASSGCRIPTP